MYGAKTAKLHSNGPKTAKLYINTANHLKIKLIKLNRRRWMKFYILVIK